MKAAVYASSIISTLLHAGLLAWAFFTIQSAAELRVAAPEPIAVAVITPDELTRLMQGDRKGDPAKSALPEKAEPAPKKTEMPKPKREPRAVEPPPAAEPAPQKPDKIEKSDPTTEKTAALDKQPTPPKPTGPTDEERRLLDEKLAAEERQRAEDAKRASEAETARLEQQRKAEEAKRKAAEKRKAEAKRRAELRKKEAERKRKEAEKQKRQKFDPTDIAALLNKTPDKSAPPPGAVKSEAATKSTRPKLGAPEGRDDRLTASEQAVLAQIIRACVQSKWTVLAGGESAQNISVKLRMRFKADGSLLEAPTVMNPQSTTLFLAVSDSAQRAVRDCEPYNLPPDKYEHWKDIVMTFNPRDMFSR